MKVSLLIMIMFWNQFLLAQETSKKLPVQLFATTDAYKIYDCQCRAETFDDYNPKIEFGGAVGVLVPIYNRFFIIMGLGRFQHHWLKTSKTTWASDLSGKYDLKLTDAIFEASVWSPRLFIGYEFGLNKFTLSPKIGLISHLSKSVHPYVTGRYYYNLSSSDDYLNMEPDASYSGRGTWNEGYSNIIQALEFSIKYMATQRLYILITTSHLFSIYPEQDKKEYSFKQFSLGLSYSIGSTKE